MRSVGLLRLGCRRTSRKVGGGGDFSHFIRFKVVDRSKVKFLVRGVVQGPALEENIHAIGSFPRDGTSRLNPFKVLCLLVGSSFP